MIEAGHSERLGATCDRDGVNFALYSADAEAVELCLFDASGKETRTLRLPVCSDGIWHGYVPGLADGQLYGYRVHGPYAPERGLRFNSCKLVLDPYAREVSGRLSWRREVFDYARFEPTRGLVPSISDSAPHVPKGVVRNEMKPALPNTRIPWAETIVYEANVRGYTMLHPAIEEADRGTFRGMRQREVLEYLQALGVTSLELMPVHAFVDEEFLVARGHRNLWGYNTLGFFAPAPRLLGGGGIDDFREMVDAIHQAGIEVILDVVYNHTAEGGKLGPTLSLRGIDNRSYYRLLPEDHSEYINDTGCGNTINTDHAAVRRLILESLRYWVEAMGVDGFRFDLASILGRTESGFDREHPFFIELSEDPVLSGVKLIAEPWDVGPGGYQLGGFPAPWAEWNDRFRDGTRRFWCSDPGVAPEFARRVHGSADLFETSGRTPFSSINFVTSHDGFTLADLVSYETRHNEANGEDNHDGHQHNFSLNHGVEGVTDDPQILASRRRHRLSLLTTLFCSQGTPMLLAGDEFGNSQFGNNNAYSQDNEIGWIDWTGADADPEFTAAVRTLIGLRKSLPLLRQTVYRHGGEHGELGQPDIFWFGPDGQALDDDAWHSTQALGLLLTEPASVVHVNTGACALLLNSSGEDHVFRLPELAAGGRWRLAFHSAAGAPGTLDANEAPLEPLAAACLVFELDDSQDQETRSGSGGRRGRRQER